MADQSDKLLSMGDNWGDAEEQRLGVIWFLAAGLAAVLLALFLFNADRYLEKNDRRIPVGNLLQTLRSAQTSIAQAPIDPRVGELPPAAWYASSHSVKSNSEVHHHSAHDVHTNEAHGEGHGAGTAEHQAGAEDAVHHEDSHSGDASH